VRRGGLWAKHMRLKRGAIGNTLGNLMATSREHVGNKKIEKKSSSSLHTPHPQNLKEK